ncbi:MAG: roadblock/LC7 domain-containing protein [Thermotogae bacterium]|nr:roadblock/LC7 domain-containing protein [Thermotogota bacterium]
MAAIHTLDERLKKFVSDTEGVVGVVISTPEGLTFAYQADRPFEPDAYAAIVASLYSLASKSGRAGDMGKVKEITIHMEEGSFIVFPLGNLILGIIALPNAITGMILTNARRMLRDLEELEDAFFV